MNKITRDVEIKRIIQRECLDDFDSLKRYINKNPDGYDFQTLSKLAELSNSRRAESAAHYTRDDVCEQFVASLPDFNKQEKIRILEPSVGVGNFIPHLIKKYKTKKLVEIDVIDINPESLGLLRVLIRKFELPENVKINYINADFLLLDEIGGYDLVVGNPPFMRIKEREKLLKYKKGRINTKTPNIFSFFVEKSLIVGSHVSFILPKSLVNAPEYNLTREYLQTLTLDHIFDFGEKAFSGVKIETIGISISSRPCRKGHKVKITSHITNDTKKLVQSYVCSDNYPYWLLYRCTFFDEVSSRLKLGVFDVFRDRQITKKYTKSNGTFRVLKSRNIASNLIIDIPGYDSYVDDVNGFAVGKYLNKTSLVLVPNLTYNPRACFMPKNTITDGSVAILSSKLSGQVTKADLGYFNSDEFVKFYAIARNFGTRSLNIDSNSVYFFGIK